MLAATCDGASVNRRLVKLHDLKASLIFKVPNLCASDKRDLFFFSDPPHLMKTTRNCWASKARSLWVCVISTVILSHLLLLNLHRTMIMTSLGHTWYLSMNKMLEKHQVSLLFQS